MKVKRTHCGRGHEFNAANTYEHGGKRYCKACASFNQKRRGRTESIKRAEKKYYANNRDKISEGDRKRRLMRKFGITPEQYAAMHTSQNGNCKCCGKPTEVLVVDHHHETGKVRGLLCSQCNVGIGMFHEDPEKMMNAIRYLVDAHPEKAYTA